MVESARMDQKKQKDIDDMEWCRDEILSLKQKLDQNNSWRNANPQLQDSLSLYPIRSHKNASKLPLRSYRSCPPSICKSNPKFSIKHFLFPNASRTKESNDIDQQQIAATLCWMRAAV